MPLQPPGSVLGPRTTQVLDGAAQGTPANDEPLGEWETLKVKAVSQSLYPIIMIEKVVLVNGSKDQKQQHNCCDERRLQRFKQSYERAPRRLDDDIIC
jgi:hypothetical protein